MYLQGKIRYKNGNSTNYLLNGNKLYTNPTKEIKFSDIKYNNKYVEIGNGDKLSDKLEEIGAQLTFIPNWNYNDLCIGYDYLKNNYPSTFKQKYVGVYDINSMIEIDLDGSTLQSALKIINGYLEGYTGIYGDNTIFELLDGEYGYYILPLFESYKDGSEKEPALQVLKDVIKNELFNNFNEFDYINTDWWDDKQPMDFFEKELIEDIYNQVGKVQKELSKLNSKFNKYIIPAQESDIKIKEQERQERIAKYKDNRKQPVSEKYNYLVN